MEDFVERLDGLEKRLRSLEFANKPLGPNPKQGEELEREGMFKQIADALEAVVLMKKGAHKTLGEDQ